MPNTSASSAPDTLPRNASSKPSRLSLRWIALMALMSAVSTAPPVDRMVASSYSLPWGWSIHRFAASLYVGRRVGRRHPDAQVVQTLDGLPHHDVVLCMTQRRLREGAIRLVNRALVDGPVLLRAQILEPVAPQ